MGEGLEKCSLPLSLGCVEGNREVLVGKTDESPPSVPVGESLPLDGLEDGSNPGEEDSSPDSDFIFCAEVAPTYRHEGRGGRAGRNRRSKFPQPSPAPIWVRAGEYRLASCWREWALRHMGISPLQIAVDLFSRKGLGACAIEIDRAQNAFAFDWSKLNQELPDSYLWANPPFAMMHRVLGKIALEECRVILVAPIWEEKSWWPVLKRMTSHSVVLPGGYSPFYGAILLNLLPPPKWRVMVCVIDSTKGKFPPPPPRLGKFLVAESRGWGPEHLKCTPMDPKGGERSDPSSSMGGEQRPLPPFHLLRVGLRASPSGHKRPQEVCPPGLTSSTPPTWRLLQGEWKAPLLALEVGLI